MVEADDPAAGDGDPEPRPVRDRLGLGHLRQTALGTPAPTAIRSMASSRRSISCSVL
jgi:hypothetical protein